MTETTVRTRTCDQCSADLTVTDCVYDLHYVLSREFTPSSERVSYNYPYPEPPDDCHFCGKECLVRWLSGTFGKDITPEMINAGGDVLAATGAFGSIGNYVEQRKIARDVFRAMWAARGRLWISN